MNGAYILKKPSQADWLNLIKSKKRKEKETNNKKEHYRNVRTCSSDEIK